MTALAWEGCLNVRDLGGLPTEDGRRTRDGSVIRSDNIRRLTDAGWRSLAAHGVERIVDLRFPEELADDPPRDVDLDVVHVSVLGPELDLDYIAELAPNLKLWIEEADDEQEREKRLKLSGTPAAGMIRTIEEVERRYGGVAEYLRAAGLSEAQIARLRERLVAP